MSLDFDAQRYTYPSRRSVVFGARGMVATSQSLAAQAGLDILKKGGNAVDAAIAAAACLTVVEPTSCGIGGDAFAIVSVMDKLYGLNASGPAPAAADADFLRQQPSKEIPRYGWYPVTVPGVPAAWSALSNRFGTMPLSKVMRPAIDYAVKGFAVSPNVSRLWHRAHAIYSECRGNEFAPWFETFCPAGHAPEPGELWTLPEHADTLSLIADSDGEAFYRGELAERIQQFSDQFDGWLKASDLAAYQPEWVEPISVNYRGYDVWELPPNGQGIAALMALNILKGFELSQARESEENYHLLIESMKLAFADVERYVADPRSMPYGTPELLSEIYAAERRKLIGERALMPIYGVPPKGGTVYLATADDEGNMVSLIQSNYMGFGSGLVVPGTGIALQNRGCGFSLDDSSPNVLAPSKKPYHTIIPGFLSKDGKSIGPFGVMGAFMQPQGHLQVVTNMIDFCMNPQEALDAPRWQWTKERTVLVEQGVPSHIVYGLMNRGHEVQVSPDPISFGRGEIIVRTSFGTLAGATEPRTDGSVAAW